MSALRSGAAAVLACALAALAAGGCAPETLRPTLVPSLPLVSTPDAPFRASAPSALPTERAPLPTVERFALANGLTVFLAPRADTQTVAIEFVARRGGADDVAVPEELPGTVSRVLLESLRHDARGALTAVARRGAQLDAGVAYDFGELQVYALADELPLAIDALGRAVTAPTFDENVLARARDDQLERRRALAIGYDRALRDVALSGLFGTGHPYGRSLVGNVETIRALTLAQAAAFYQQRYVPSECALVVAGPVDRARLEPLLAPTLGTWGLASARPAAPVQRLRVRPWARVHLIHEPGLRSARIALAFQTVPGNARDRLAIDVLADVLGGMFTSRLNQDLRERAGLTYSVTASQFSGRADGALLVQTSVEQERALEALGLLLADIGQLRERGLQPRELATAIARQRHGLYEGFESNAAAAATVAARYESDLRGDDLTDDAVQLDALRLEDVQRVAREHLDVAGAEIVVLGDAAELQLGLQLMFHGNVEMLVFRAH